MTESQTCCGGTSSGPRPGWSMSSPPGLSGISVGWPAGSSSGVGCTGRSGGDCGSIVSGFGLGSGSGLLAIVILLELNNERARRMFRWRASSMFRLRNSGLCALALGDASAIAPRGPHGRARQRAISCTRPKTPAGVAELVDALVLGTSIARCGGSSPFARTILQCRPGSWGVPPLLAGFDTRF